MKELLILIIKKHVPEYFKNLTKLFNKKLRKN